MRFNTYDLTFERQLNCPKCFTTMSLWHSNDLSTMLCHQFLGAISSLNLSEASCLFREYLKFIQFKNCIKSASYYFYFFNGFTDNSTKSVTMVMCQMGMWLNLVYVCFYFSLSIKHGGFPIMTLKLTTRYLSIQPRASLVLLNIYYFRFNIFKKGTFNQLL